MPWAEVTRLTSVASCEALRKLAGKYLPEAMGGP